jgi:SAM-dependent methyltransferase
MNQREKQAHWDKAFTANSATEVSWYTPHLETSLAFIRRAAPDLSTPILDVGAGESTLVDDLLAAGYGKITLLDISPQALDHTRARLGAQQYKLSWSYGDILTIPLPDQQFGTLPRRPHFGLWHDRAVFHFLTSPADRATYVAQVARALRPGGHVILATFAPDGPIMCSGLPVQRHDADSILQEFGPRFTLAHAETEHHTTPSGVTQPFIYCDLVFT